MRQQVFVLSWAFLVTLTMATTMADLELKGGQSVFDKQVLEAAKQGKKETLVMFYASWCPHCQEAKPKFIEAAKKLESDASKGLAMVNCEEGSNAAVCSAQKVEGYPTMKLFKKDGTAQDFAEDFHNVDNIVNFVKNPPPPGQDPPMGQENQGQGQGQPDNQPMKGVPMVGSANFSSLLNQYQNTLVFFYAPWCPHCVEAKPKIQAAAAELKAKGIQTDTGEKTKIAAMNCDAAEAKERCDKEKIEGFPTVRYYKKDEMYAEYEEEVDAGNMLKFLSKPPKTKVAPTPTDDSKATEAPETQAQGQQQMQQQGQKPPGAEGQEKELTEADMKPEAESEKMKGVEYLSGEAAFNHKFQSAKKHNIIMFYAPWCGHCQEAKPHYQAAANAVHKKYSDRQMFALNCDDKANEQVCQKQNVDGFPTFRHYSDGKMVKELELAPATKDNLLQYVNSIKTYANLKKDEL